MPKAGKNYKKLRVSTNSTTGSDGTWGLIKGISEAGINRAGDEIDVTDFASVSAFKQYILGLKEFEISMSGQYEPGDTTGQVLLDTAQNNGTNVWIQYLLKNDDDALYSGVAAECIITNFSQSGSVSDKEGVEITAKLAYEATPANVSNVTVLS